jgi:kynurenine formamidase
MNLKILVLISILIQTFPVHTFLGSKNIFLLENVGNLHLVPQTGFRVFVFPIKLDGASGSPARLFAVY